jgi:hypothetical protein
MVFYGILIENTGKRETQEKTLSAQTPATVTARVNLGKQEKLGELMYNNVQTEHGRPRRSNLNARIKNKTCWNNNSKHTTNSIIADYVTDLARRSVQGTIK